MCSNSNKFLLNRKSYLVNIIETFVAFVSNKMQSKYTYIYLYTYNGCVVYVTYIYYIVYHLHSSCISGSFIYKIGILFTINIQHLHNHSLSALLRQLTQRIRVDSARDITKRL